MDRTSEAINQLVAAMGALAAAQVAAEVERIAPELLAHVTDQLPAPQPVPVSAPAEVWLTVAEAARRSGRHAQTIRAALHEYERSKHKRGLRGGQPTAGGRWRIRPDDLAAWIDGEAPKRRQP